MKRAKLPPAPRAVRPPTVPHAWTDPVLGDLPPDAEVTWHVIQNRFGDRVECRAGVRWWWLEHARAPGGLSTPVRSSFGAWGRARICDRCGVVVVYVELFDGEGNALQVALYGLDLDNLTPMRAAPSCEALTMPARPRDEDDDDNAAANGCDATRAA